MFEATKTAREIRNNLKLIGLDSETEGRGTSQLGADVFAVTGITWI